jgi:hypothetical protein
MLTKAKKDLANIKTLNLDRPGHKNYIPPKELFEKKNFFTPNPDDITVFDGSSHTVQSRSLVLMTNIF